MHADSVDTLGDGESALTTWQKWAPEFMRASECLEDYPKTGHPACVTSKENIDLFQHSW